MLTQKRCPKCGGNIYMDRDSYGWYEQCLQCSYTRDLVNIGELTEHVVPAKRKTRKVKH
jgi:hypothetical protein